LKGEKEGGNFYVVLLYIVYKMVIKEQTALLGVGKESAVTGKWLMGEKLSLAPLGSIGTSSLINK
jgi:hypothetical protein